MAFDGLFTTASVEELRREILTGRITKIYQLSKYEMLFTVRQQRQNKKVLFSVHPTYARIQMTKLDYSHSSEPPMFCMLMRKHLESTIIIDIEQINNDRIIKFTLVHRSEFGGDTTKYLYLEVMNKHSNFILTTEDGVIIDCIKHISPIMNRHRALQPSATYILPPSRSKIEPSDATLAHFEAIVSDKETIPAKGIMNTFNGLSRLIANEVIHRINKEGKTIIPAKLGDFALEAFNEVMKEVTNYPKPSITLGEKEQFYLIPLTHLGSDIKTFETIGDLLDAFYFGKERKDRIRDHFSNIDSLVNQWKNKNVKKLAKLEQELANTEKAEEYRVKGELILSNTHQLNRGDKMLVTQNFYEADLPEIKIELNDQLTAPENAQVYFKRYNKAKAAVAHIEEQMEKANEEIEYFESLLIFLASADVEDVYEIQDELRNRGYLKKRTERKGKRPSKPNIDRYVTESGIEILVGKNNLQNDYITHTASRRHEWWFHVKDMPGSHVVVKSDADQLEELEIRTAANLAAYFSKGKYSSSVAIDYTQIKNLKKVPGSAIGFVTYDVYKTIYIDPDEAEILNLKRVK